MALLIHVAIALSSVAFATYLFFSPTATKLRVSYGLVALTLASGTYLVVSARANLIRACVTGLVYVSVVSVINAYSRQKLVKETV